jgi:hypothetical protein
MALEDKPVNSITEVDLQALVDDEMQESRTLEYKQMLPGGSDDDKKEFLYDVVAFANASGGLIIYGIREEAEVAAEVCGVEVVDIATEIRRLDRIIHDGIDPRIPGLEIRGVNLANSRIAILVRIPNSWARPHMVTFKGSSKFYSRRGSVKYQLDVREIRAAFELSSTTAERIRDFRVEHLAAISDGETPVPLAEGGKVVLHLVPLRAFDPTVRFDVSALLSDQNRLRYITPFAASSWGWNYNFDGVVTHARAGYESPEYASYVQFFRNGIIEAVDADLLRVYSLTQSKTIPFDTFEQRLMEGAERYASAQRLLGVEAPIFVMASFLGVRGYSMSISTSRLGHGQPIDRQNLIVPEVMIESLDVEFAQVMRPVFDAVWNAAGWPHSLNYGEDGQWRAFGR